MGNSFKKINDSAYVIAVDGLYGAFKDSGFRALKAKKDDANVDKIGMKAAFGELLAVLERWGLKSFSQPQSICIDNGMSGQDARRLYIIGPCGLADPEHPDDPDYKTVFLYLNTRTKKGWRRADGVNKITMSF